ncbi:MAG: hypothetical protein ACO3A4_05750, partial [Silvanigrellaceae bacterium]
MNSKIRLIVLLLPFFSACTTTRVVSVRPGKGGVIAINQGIFGGDARSQAESMMRSNCRGPFRIVKESEAVVGSVSNTQGQTQGQFNNYNRGANFNSNSASTTTTGNVTEWR